MFLNAPGQTTFFSGFRSWRAPANMSRAHVPPTSWRSVLPSAFADKRNLTQTRDAPNRAPDIEYFLRIRGFLSSLQDLYWRAHLQTWNSKNKFSCLHVFEKIPHPIATSVNIATFSSCASIASVIEWSRRHSYSISSSPYESHRSVFCTRASDSASRMV